MAGGGDVPQTCSVRAATEEQVRGEEPVGDWADERRQEAYHRLMVAVLDRFGLEEGRRNVVSRSGFLGYDVETWRSRVVLVVDPEIVDIRRLRTWASAAARRTSRHAHVRGAPLTVAVRQGCFAAAEYERVLALLRKDRRFSSLRNRVQPDGRIHATFCPDDVAYAEKVQRRVGAIFEYTEGCVHGV